MQLELQTIDSLRNMVEKSQLLISEYNKEK